MVQGKGDGAALRAYRKAQKLCASTPDIAYMPQVCLRVAQYETLEKAIFNQSRRLVAEPAAELDVILPSDLEL